MEKILEYTFEFLFIAIIFINVFRMFFEVLLAISF